MSHVHAFPYICSFPLIYLDILELFLGLFCLSLSLPLSSICVSLCLWHPNASLLRPRTLFVSGHLLHLILLLHLFGFLIRMPERPSRRNFSRWDIHFECQVILANFADIYLPTVIHSWCWESLCDVPVTCPSVLIHEFYSNMHGFGFSVPHFIPHIWGTRIALTPQIVADVLRVLRVKFPDYLGCECLRTVFKDELMFAFYECPSD